MREVLMKPWQFALVSLALLATTGCRSDPAVPVLERELRRKEDEIYRLRAALEEFQDCGSCQEVAGGSPKPAAAEPDAAPRRRAGSAVGNGIAPPAIEMPSQPSSGLPDSLKSPGPGGSSLPQGLKVPESLRGPSKPLSPKEVEPAGPATKPPTDRTLSPRPSQSDGPALEKGAGGVTSRSGRVNLASLSASALPLTPSGDSRRVAGITLNRTLTGSIPADDRLGRSGAAGRYRTARPRGPTGRCPGRGKRGGAGPGPPGRCRTGGPLGFHPRGNRRHVSP